MLGLILIYFIGKQFYKLAEEYDKKPWNFAILSIVVYYGTTIFLGFVVGIMYAIMDKVPDIDSSSEFMLGLILLPFGLLAVYLLHRFLEKKWEKERAQEEVVIEDIGKH